MNDRFKFRLWHKPLKTMHYNDFIVTATGYMAKIYQQDDYMMKFNQEDLEFDKQCILMQCTGLKDKNGKLIYEEDIVKIKNEVFFIKYEIGSFLIIRNEQSLDAWYEMFTEAWNDDVYPLSQLYVDEYIQEEYIDCIEVIGNIYENEELLESEGYKEKCE